MRRNAKGVAPSGTADVRHCEVEIDSPARSYSAQIKDTLLVRPTFMDVSDDGTAVSSAAASLEGSASPTPDGETSSPSA